MLTGMSTSSMGTARLLAAVALQNLQAVLDNRTADASVRARRLIREWVEAPKTARIVVDPEQPGVSLDGNVVRVAPLQAEGALMMARSEQRVALARRYRQHCN